MVVVTGEFERIASRIAALKGHASLKTLVLPYPLESRPAEECREIAADSFPRLLEILGVRS